MSIFKKENQLLSIVLVLFSLFIIIFFIKDMFYEMQANNIKSSENNKILTQKEEELKKLNEAKNRLDNIKDIDKNSKTLTVKQKEGLEILKISRKFKEDEILLYLKDYAENFNKQADEEMISIKSLNFTEAKESELGFLETQINISAKVKNNEAMKTFLSFLT
jgi:transcription initiation factor TFIIIB Brf1 subunit/transcription initiation factor TFIIB